MSDTAIRVENLSKLYHIGKAQQRYDTLRDALVAPFQRLAESARHPPFAIRHLPSEDTLWALKDVSFEVKRGEVVGIIGRNGAGKSTLLKILSRITEPTEGRAEIHGRVGSLLEVGTGFHPELTGRENIYLNGAILGMKRAEIENKFDEMVAFAEIEKFLDTPVKHYSSGMYVRLAFAVAAHLEPEILLIDEVLAVGDAAFQKKCLGKMGDVAKEGRTVLFVSHNMGAVRRLCGRCVWLDEGRLRFQSSAEEVISRYLKEDSGTLGQRIWRTGVSNLGVDCLKVFSVSVVREDGSVASTLGAHESFYLEVCYSITVHLPHCRIGFVLSTLDSVAVFETYDTDMEGFTGQRKPGDYVMRCRVPANLLNPGDYIISINAGIPNNRNLVWVEGALMLNIEDTSALGPYLSLKRVGVIRPRLTWECEERHASH
jgi:lipopolysaccharide transport system ATP-binding protein